MFSTRHAPVAAAPSAAITTFEQDPEQQQQQEEEQQQQKEENRRHVTIVDGQCLQELGCLSITITDIGPGMELVSG